MKTKGSSEDMMPMAPEEDQDEVSVTPVPDLTINPKDLEDLDKLINDSGKDVENDYVAWKKKKALLKKQVSIIDNRHDYNQSN